LGVNYRQANKSLDHFLNLIGHCIAGIMHIHQEKNDCDKQKDEEFQDALENRIEEHHSQNHTDSEIHGVGHHFVEQILHKDYPVLISVKLMFAFPLFPHGVQG